jgi:hypothetical protein
MVLRNFTASNVIPVPGFASNDQIYKVVPR